MSFISPAHRIIRDRGGMPVGDALNPGLPTADHDAIVTPTADGVSLTEMRHMSDKDGPLDAEGVYQPFLSDDGFSSMGFETVRRDGKRDLFFYPSLGDVGYTVDEFGEYLTFYHRTKAVTLKGANLLPVLDMIKRHTLTTLFEYPGGETPYRRSAPMITIIDLALLNEARAQ